MVGIVVAFGGLAAGTVGGFVGFGTVTVVRQS